MHSVLNRAVKKYEQRVSTIEQGGSWQRVKEKQKKMLEEEQSKVKKG